MWNWIVVFLLLISVQAIPVGFFTDSNCGQTEEYRYFYQFKPLTCYQTRNYADDCSLQISCLSLGLDYQEYLNCVIYGNTDNSSSVSGSFQIFQNQTGVYQRSFSDSSCSSMGGVSRYESDCNLNQCGFKRKELILDQSSDSEDDSALAALIGVPVGVLALIGIFCGALIFIGLMVLTAVIIAAIVVGFVMMVINYKKIASTQAEPEDSEELSDLDPEFMLEEHSDLDQDSDLEEL